MFKNKVVCKVISLYKILFSYLFILFLLISTNSAIAGRCTGSSNCSACTTCSSCKHCNASGGSCGVCEGGSISSNESSQWFLWPIGIIIVVFLLIKYFNNSKFKN